MPFLKIIQELSAECPELESIILCDEEGERVYAHYCQLAQDKELLAFGHIEDLEYRVDVEGALFAVLVEESFSLMGKNQSIVHLNKKSYYFQVLDFGYYLLCRSSTEHKHIFQSRKYLFERIMLDLSKALN